MVYLVTWDLNREKPNYPAARTQLIQQLSQHENTHHPGLDSVRFVSTNLTAKELYENLSSALDKNDKIVIARMSSGGYWGALTADIWEWIASRL